VLVKLARFAFRSVLLRGKELENLAHDALCLIGLKQVLGVRRTFENDQRFLVRELSCTAPEF
jgi:hypothetical protein